MKKICIPKKKKKEKPFCIFIHESLLYSDLRVQKIISRTGKFGIKYIKIAESLSNKK